MLPNRCAPPTRHDHTYPCTTTHSPTYLHHLPFLHGGTTSCLGDGRGITARKCSVILDIIILSSSPDTLSMSIFCSKHFLLMLTLLMTLTQTSDCHLVLPRECADDGEDARVCPRRDDGTVQYVWK